MGPEGWVFATEINPELLRDIQKRVTAAGLGHVTVVLGHAGDTGLPRDCCDAILLRNVYHHITETAAMQASLAAALRDGGRLAIIDFEPGGRSNAGPGAATNRGGHGQTKDGLIEEMTAAGFRALAEYEPWGSGRRRDYGVVFTKD